MLLPAFRAGCPIFAADFAAAKMGILAAGNIPPYTSVTSRQLLIRSASRPQAYTSLVGVSWLQVLKDGAMYYPERRKYPRFKVRAGVEVRQEGRDAPIRCTTSDLSLGGCYIESMYPFPVGTGLELQLQVEDTLLIVAKVATSYPQVGNGIQFIKILPEDRAKLSAFLDSVAKQEAAAAEK